jgi:hypothetical protein
MTKKLSVGDVVLMEENIPRVVWKMGRILELLLGKDGLVRSVKIQTAYGTISIRPVARICHLEM